jgi:hypothetical protein
MSFFPSSGWGHAGDIGRGGDRKKRELRSFRFRSVALQELDRMAQEHEINANQILERFLDRELILGHLWPQIHPVTIGREDLKRVLDIARDTEEGPSRLVTAGGEFGGTVPKQMFATHNVRPGWDTVIRSLDQVYGKTCNWFRFRHHVEGEDQHRLVFTHQLGLGWTDFQRGYQTEMLRSLLKAEPKITTETDRMLVLRT